MVTSEQGSENNFRVQITPNSSLNGSVRYFFLGSIIFICSIIGIGFFFVGGVLILPFAGLEIFLVLLAFSISFRWSSQKQIILLSQEQVEIQKGYSKQLFTWKEFRTFTSFNVMKKGQEELELSFQSKGEKIIIGDFLNEDDKKILRDTISEIISVLNEQQFIATNT